MEDNKINDFIEIKLIKTGIKYEDYEELEKSPLQNIYMEAFQRTGDIIERNKTLQEDALKGKSSRKYREVYNIVPFIGGRGTGKTSAMLSFMEAIKDYSRLMDRDQIKAPYSFGGTGKNPLVFTCLDCIDCSLLENDEDIFKIILAQMYQKFMELDANGMYKEKDYEYKKRDLLIEFNRIYKTISQFNSKESDYGTTAGDNLRYFSSSMDLKDIFEKFVERYLALIKYDENCRNICSNQIENHYLVIALDDFDLNVENGFSILEKVHRYMMVPRVILLMAFDTEQLGMLCRKHFYAEVPRVDKLLVKNEIAITELANEYLNKIIPVETRIYMPDLNKNKERYRVRHTKTGELCSIKELLFLMFYERTKIRWDIGGIKQHFYEPETFREDVGLYQMLDFMKSFDSPDLITEKVYPSQFKVLLNTNYSIIFSDLTNRLVPELLIKYDNYDYFTRLAKMDASRYCTDFFNYMIEKKAENNDNKEKVEYNITFRDMAKQFGYSYGELARSIYYWGREITNNASRKAIIKCFLALFTIDFSKLYWTYRNESNSVKKEKCLKQILQLMGGSVTGSWVANFFPKLRLNNVQQDSSKKDKNIFCLNDSFYLSNMYEIGIPYDLSTILDDCFMDSDMEGGQEQDIIQTIELISMCFCYKSGMPVQWKFELVKQQQPENVPKTEDTLSHVRTKAPDKYKLKYVGDDENSDVFNIMNFVVNSMDYKTVLHSVKDAFLNAYYSAFERENPGSTITDFEKKSLEKTYDKLSIRNKFDTWNRKYSEFALPVYDFDLTYNLLKRISKTGNYKRCIRSEDICSEVNGVFSEIFDLLSENDSFYKLKNQKANLNLAVCFSECPFVKAFKVDKNVDKNHFFEDAFKDFAIKMAISQTYDVDMASVDDL